MTGAQKAAAIITLVVIAMALFNWSLWRRLKAAQAQRIGWTDTDFDAMLMASGVSASVPPVVRAVIAPYYGPDISPHPDDDFARFLAVDPAEVEDLVEAAWQRLGLPLPTLADPETLPPIKDVRDLADYLDSVVRQRDAA